MKEDSEEVVNPKARALKVQGLEGVGVGTDSLQKAP